MSATLRVLARVSASLLDSFAALTGLYYSKKYAAVVKRLGLRTAPAHGREQPGLIVVQMDGLSHAHLEEALDLRRLPNLRRLLHSGFALSRWPCGLPSSTPAAQAGIMYGSNEGIPAFRWYDKAQRRSVVCKVPGTLVALQESAANQNPGILQSGSSYVNMFDGGASSSLFTLSAMHPRHFFEGVRGVGLAALFLLNPLRVLRILYLSVKEYVTDAIQRWSARMKGQSYLPVLGIFPFLRIFSNVIFREVETFAVLVDIYRGVPAIYATFYGYDEIAHHFGLRSRAALQSLHDIDRCIGQIIRLSRAGLSRPYTLCVLSDHGLTPSEPFVERYGQTVGQFISQQLGKPVFLAEQADHERDHMFQMRFLLGELRAIEANLGTQAARVARRIRLLVTRRLRRSRRLPCWEEARWHDVVVKNSGSLAHVYLNIANRRLDLSEITSAFPDLVIKALAHPGIWLVVAREEAQTLIMSQEGVLTFVDGKKPIVEGRNPLLSLPDSEPAAEQIQRIAGFQASGDLILFGSYDAEKDLVVCFEKQRASHGGLGGAQDYPFIICPQSVQWDLSQVRDARDLYPFFAQQRQLGPQSPSRDTA